MTVMHIPGHIERKDGDADFATCVTTDIPHASDMAYQSHHRICASKGGAILATRFGMEKSDPTYHWAHVTIIETRTIIVAKETLVNGAERHWRNTICSIDEAMAERRKLALNPYVTTATNNEIYDQLMTFAEQAQRYLSSKQHNIQDLRAVRTRHHEELDLPTSKAASSTDDHQHDQQRGPTGTAHSATR